MRDEGWRGRGALKSAERSGRRRRRRRRRRSCVVEIQCANIKRRYRPLSPVDTDGWRHQIHVSSSTSSSAQDPGMQIQVVFLVYFPRVKPKRRVGMASGRFLALRPRSRSSKLTERSPADYGASSNLHIQNTGEFNSLILHKLSSLTNRATWDYTSVLCVFFCLFGGKFKTKRSGDAEGFLRIIIKMSNRKGSQCCLQMFVIICFILENHFIFNLWL